MMNTTETLAGLLLAAIEQAEKDAHEVHDKDCFLFQDPGSSACDCQQAAIIQRHCAAHRKIVEQYARTTNARDNYGARSRFEPGNEHARACYLKATDEASALYEVMTALADAMDVRVGDQR